MRIQLESAQLLLKIMFLLVSFLQSEQGKGGTILFPQYILLKPVEMQSGILWRSKKKYIELI